jgi:hypothetical protein
MRILNFHRCRDLLPGQIRDRDACARGIPQLVIDKDQYFIIGISDLENRFAGHSPECENHHDENQYRTVRAFANSKHLQPG